MTNFKNGSLFEIKRYDFDPASLPTIENIDKVKNFWPLVYILSDGEIKEAYVGETTDASTRMSAHLNNKSKNKLTAVHLISSDKFNKSATLDIESNLIRYLSGDGQFKLLNGNVGLANHNYYQKREVYWNIFKTLWNELRSEGITHNTLEHIDNSDLFKYSPYKALSKDQKTSLIAIIKCLLNKQTKSIVVEGGAGTGKTILAIYLFKLLKSYPDDLNFTEFGVQEKELARLVQKLQETYPCPKVALVVPMSSFRNTLKKVFRNVKGLNSSMVIGPAELALQKYDILMVDESHRLRKRVNLGSYFGSFDTVNEKLKLPKEQGNELDWVLMRGRKQILFYDEDQSIKPSDVDKRYFDALKASSTTATEKLKSQFRVKGDNDYVTHVDKLLTCDFPKGNCFFDSSKYEFLLFDSLEKMVEKIKARDAENGLSRLIAGYSWKWVSKKNKNAFDIKIDGIKLRWNRVSDDWVNSDKAVEEVGCIHTTQGYDLNYAGIIFGHEISYDLNKKEIVIKGNNYFDKNGKHSIKDAEELKGYIINIYKTIMLRAIHGTYVYVCDPHLKEYFKKHIRAALSETSLKIMPLQEVKPYVNAVPLYDISVAAGDFSDKQQVPHVEWVELPTKFKPQKDLFVCKVIGDSMNKRIPNGSWCLFKKYSGGSREGQIVLVQHYNVQDPDFGAGYTIKYYHSEKVIGQSSWSHKAIVLRPSSSISDYKEITLDSHEATELKVIGIFVDVVSEH